MSKVGIGKGDRCLDVGCSLGGLSVYLMKVKKKLGGLCVNVGFVLFIHTGIQSRCHWSGFVLHCCSDGCAEY